MNQKEQQLSNTRNNVLVVVEAAQAEIKGNPLTQDSRMTDLEPSGEVKGGPTKRIWDYIRTS